MVATGTPPPPLDAMSDPRLPVLRRGGHVERVGLWGGQIVTSQWRCGACGSYFEALREDFAADVGGAARGTHLGLGRL